jgi:hypothetical protein
MDLQFSVLGWPKLQKSRIPFQNFRRQLSQLSDGPSNGSNRLAICELQQSDTRPVAESAFPDIMVKFCQKPDLYRKVHFWADCTFLYKSGFWQNFPMTSPETSYTKNVSNALRFLLSAHTTCFDIHFGRYGILKSGSISGQILDRLGYRCLVRF